MAVSSHSAQLEQSVKTEPAVQQDAASKAPVLDAQEQKETQDGLKPPQAQNLRRIMSIKVPLIVKLAEKKIKISEILKLGLGSVIQFDKDAYQHVDLMVNNTTIGLGQTVKVGENFGLKITQVGDLRDTIKSLGGVPKPGV